MVGSAGPRRYDPRVTSLLSIPGLDTWLARALLEAGRVEYQTLHGLLTRVRVQRRSAPRTLALELAERGLVRREELEVVLGQIQGVADERGWRVGSVCADISLLSVLGVGGMGEVFLGRDLKTGAEVAVKTISLGEDTALQERFSREAEAQARVDAHPGVVRIHRAGSWGGRAYLVMDALAGGSLEARLAAGPLGAREAASLTLKLAQGLAYAHAQGILHRDLKPSNVLFDAQGEPRLADFGLARLADAERLTQTGEVLGTPSYMAPEQARGLAQDERTDVYGLGGVLFAALTGQAPFSGAGVWALLDQVLHAPAPDPARLAPATPAALAAICLRCLEKSPDDRYESATQLGAELERYLASASRSARPPRALLGAGIVLLCVAVAGAAGALWPRSESTPLESPSEATAPSAVRSLRPRRALSEDEVKAEVLDAGEGLRGALLAERYLVQGREPQRWLQGRCREPLWSREFPMVAGVVPLGERHLLLWRTLRGLSDGAPLTVLLDAASGEELRAWNRVLAAVSPQGSLVALAGPESLTWYDAATWKEQGRAEFKVRAAAFLAETLLVVLVEDEVLKIELGAGEVSRLAGVEDADFLVVEPSGSIIVARGRDSDRAHLSCLTSEGRLLWACEGKLDGKPRALSCSPGGGWIALGTSTGRVHLFRSQGGAGSDRTPQLSLGGLVDPLGIPKVLEGSVASLTWLGEDRLLVLGGSGEGFSVWGVSGDLLLPERGAEFKPLRVEFGPQRRRFYLASLKRGRVWGFVSAGFFPEFAGSSPR